MEINFEELRYAQENRNSRIVNDLVKNLMYFGFYKNCKVFFESKSNFSAKFFDEIDFIGIMEDKFRLDLKRS